MTKGGRDVSDHQPPSPSSSAPPGEVWLISGIPGAGKSSTARLLAKRFPQAVHIEGDALQECILSGGVWPGDEPLAESRRQIRLNVSNQCLLARSYCHAGFTTVIDYVIQDPATHLAQLPGLAVYFVVLAPGKTAAVERDRERTKSIQHAATHGSSIAERFAYLEWGFETTRHRGLWLDTRDMALEDVVETVLSHRQEALIQQAPASS